MTEINVTRFPGDDFETATIRVSVETLNAVMSILGEARDETDTYLLNDFYDAVEAVGIAGEGFDTRMVDNPNYDSNEGDVFPPVIPAVFRA